MSLSRVGHIQLCRSVAGGGSQQKKTEPHSPVRIYSRNIILCGDGLSQDVPQGFVCIHLERKKCYSVRGTQGDAATINLRCALHYLRNYGMECAGVLFSPCWDGTKQTIALLEAGRSPLRDNPRHRSHETISLHMCGVARAFRSTARIQEDHHARRAASEADAPQIQACRPVGEQTERHRQTRVTPRRSLAESPDTRRRAAASQNDVARAFASIRAWAVRMSRLSL